MADKRKKKNGRWPTAAGRRSRLEKVADLISELAEEYEAFGFDESEHAIICELLSVQRRIGNMLLAEIRASVDGSFDRDD